jgi:acyl carrier protein
MSNIEKYNKIFCDTFSVEEDKLPNLKYQDVPLWDSIGHMSLISNLEESFDIMMETDDIINLSSYEIGQGILKTNYDIEF